MFSPHIFQRAQEVQEIANQVDAVHRVTAMEGAEVHLHGTPPPPSPEGGEPVERFTHESDEPDEYARGGQREGSPRSMLTVADIMSRDVMTVECDSPVRELAQLLSHKRISGAPVVDGQGKLVGVVSQADLAAYAAHVWARSKLAEERDPQGFYQGIWLTAPAERALVEQVGAEVPVADIMAPYVYFATPDASLMDLADLMLEHHIHRVVVLQGEEVVGIVSSLDLIRAFRSQFGGQRSGRRELT